MAILVSTGYDERLTSPYTGSGFVQKSRELIVGSLTLFAEHENGSRFRDSEFDLRESITLDTTGNAIVKVDFVQLDYVIICGTLPEGQLILALQSVAYQLVKPTQLPSLYWGERCMVWMPGKVTFEEFQASESRKFELESSDQALWKLSW